MLDLSIVKEAYSKMSDEQLTAFALNEGHQVSFDAFILLRDEFLKRNLDLTPIENSEEKKQLVSEERMKKIDESNSQDFIKAAWSYFFRQITDGKSDDEIVKGLIKMGIDEKQALQFIQNSLIKADELLEMHNNQITIGWISIVLCIVFLILTINYGRGFLVWPALVFGIYKLNQGYSKIGYYKKIIAVLDNRE